MLVGFYMIGFAVTWRGNLTEIAWVNTLLAVVSALALLVVTHALMPFTIALLAFASATELRAYRRRWPGLRWPVALGVDAAVLVTTSIVARPQGLPEGYAPVSVTLAFVHRRDVAVALPVGHRCSNAAAWPSHYELRSRASHLLLLPSASVALSSLRGSWTYPRACSVYRSYFWALPAMEPRLLSSIAGWDGDGISTFIRHWPACSRSVGTPWFSPMWR